MIKAGTMIADRYEILEKIGTGGMSDVYRAKCHKLNRYVAVKALKQEFSENKDFVSKFRVEAQAAAGLMHPNIVNVYDVGEENGIHYIVMELVEGITLKKYIEKKARLSVKEAVSIAIQVAMGIEAAHNNHIIHRDIKPQNIIISKEGKVKVTDFGIAKAATSNTITSNVMGSVHYTSPEQVRGGFSDEKSDIYSLGITLFEMLTGRVPFNGETTVAVAIKHIQEPMPSVREFVPEIPISVEQIVKKCTQKSPDRRYQSAPELIEDLKKSLISPDENFVKLDDNDTSGATKNVSDEELRQIKTASHQKLKAEEHPPVRKRENNRDDLEREIQDRPKKKSDNQSSGTGNSRNTGKNSASHSGKAPAKKSDNNSGKNQGKSAGRNNNSNHRPPERTGDRKNPSPQRKGKKAAEEEYDPKMEFLTTVMIVVVAVIVGCVFLYFVGSVVGIFNFTAEEQTQNTEPVAMINVVGLPAEEAASSLRALGLTVIPEYQESSTVAANLVISASAKEGEMLLPGSEVTLQISSGTNGVPIPDVTGLSRAEATAQLEREGFVVAISQANSDTVARDQVIEQSPAAETPVARGTTVSLVISLGSEIVEVQVPDIRNQTEEDAIVILAEHGLSGVMVAQEYSDTVEEGLVTYQNYSPNVTVNSGTEVEFRVSMGPEQVFYNCHTSVSAPANYAGGDAVVVLKGMDGTQLWSTTTSSFPVEINVSNIFAMSSGEVYITYNVLEQREVTDEAGNITVQSVPVQVTSDPQTVTFIKVQ
ncbi:MAG: Stk1 family PASTA domain-containing Ser/Thr kinase [Lachnospiraceae bacterium]